MIDIINNLDQESKTVLKAFHIALLPIILAGIASLPVDLGIGMSILAGAVGLSLSISFFTVLSKILN